MTTKGRKKPVWVIYREAKDGALSPAYDPHSEEWLSFSAAASAKVVAVEYAKEAHGEQFRVMRYGPSFTAEKVEQVKVMQREGV